MSASWELVAFCDPPFSARHIRQRLSVTLQRAVWDAGEEAPDNIRVSCCENIIVLQMQRLLVKMSEQYANGLSRVLIGLQSRIPWAGPAPTR